MKRLLIVDDDNKIYELLKDHPEDGDGCDGCPFRSDCRGGKGPMYSVCSDGSRAILGALHTRHWKEVKV